MAFGLSVKFLPTNAAMMAHAAWNSAPQSSDLRRPTCSIVHIAGRTIARDTPPRMVWMASVSGARSLAIQSQRVGLTVRGQACSSCLEEHWAVLEGECLTVGISRATYVVVEVLTVELSD